MMQTIERLEARDLVAVVRAYRDALGQHRGVIDRLNVYPVPDGDTGTNMALTLESVVAEIETSDAIDDLAAVTAALRHGSLMGARGNSGVILSQILRGFADAFSELGGISRSSVVAALRRATDGAYAAVGNPVEGTILSVLRAAAEAAEAAETADGAVSMIDVLDAADRAAYRALARTRQQLPALQAAGVVDAGGSGLVLLLDAFLHVADGRAMPVASPQVEEVVVAHRGGAGAGQSRDPGELRYEVMYLLEAVDETIGDFRNVWAGVGDSIVVVGGSGMWNCHIHTNDIGAAVEAGLDAGRPRRIRVTDLWDEVEEERWVREAAVAEPEPAPVVTCAVVAVCAGEGLRRVFRSLGVHQVVNGGQSMNPSTRQLTDAIDATGADQVILLPNNRNIVAVAEQAADLARQTVRVVPTSGVPEGFAALLEYDPEASAETNAATMADAARRVLTGEVTRAVRAASTAAGPVAEGDYLGLAGRTIEVVAASVRDAATGLLGYLLDGGGHEIVTVIEGEGSTPADTRAITEWLGDRYPQVVAEVLEGDQPLYPYLFGVE
jgi:DAK2 domain fusion protein YloV